jgi:hypothetical protein
VFDLTIIEHFKSTIFTLFNETEKTHQNLQMSKKDFITVFGLRQFELEKQPIKIFSLFKS